MLSSFHPGYTKLQYHPKYRVARGARVSKIPGTTTRPSSPYKHFVGPLCGYVPRWSGEIYLDSGQVRSFTEERKTERHPSTIVASLSTTRSPAPETSDSEAGRIVRSRHLHAAEVRLRFRVGPSVAKVEVRLKIAVGVAVPVLASARGNMYTLMGEA